MQAIALARRATPLPAPIGSHQLSCGMPHRPSDDMCSAPLDCRYFTGKRSHTTQNADPRDGAGKVRGGPGISWLRGQQHKNGLMRATSCGTPSGPLGHRKATQARDKGRSGPPENETTGQRSSLAQTSGRARNTRRCQLDGEGAGRLWEQFATAPIPSSARRDGRPAPKRVGAGREAFLSLVWGTGGSHKER